MGALLVEEAVDTGGWRVAATGISLSTPQRRYFPCIQVGFGRRSRLSIYVILTGL